MVHCVSTPIIETYLCYSLLFVAFRLRLVVNNGDTQTNSFIACENCTFSIIFRFIYDSDSLLFALQLLYIETTKSKNRKFASKYIILFYIVYLLLLLIIK